MSDTHAVWELLARLSGVQGFTRVLFKYRGYTDDSVRVSKGVGVWYATCLGTSRLFVYSSTRPTLESGVLPGFSLSIEVILTTPCVSQKV